MDTDGLNAAYAATKVGLTTDGHGWTRMGDQTYGQPQSPSFLFKAETDVVPSLFPRRQSWGCERLVSSQYPCPSVSIRGQKRNLPVRYSLSKIRELSSL